MERWSSVRSPRVSKGSVFQRCLPDGRASDALMPATKVFLQNRRPGRLRITLRSGIRARLEHIAVARSYDELRAIHFDSDVAPLAGSRRSRRIVAEAVLPAQLFRYRLKSCA